MCSTCKLHVVNAAIPFLAPSFKFEAGFVDENAIDYVFREMYSLCSEIYGVVPSAFASAVMHSKGYHAVDFDSGDRFVLTPKSAESSFQDWKITLADAGVRLNPLDSATARCYPHHRLTTWWDDTLCRGVVVVEVGDYGYPGGQILEV